MLRISLIASCGLLSASSPALSQMTFVDVTDQTGFTTPLPTHGAGAAVGDYNGDGWLDICVFGAVDPVPQLWNGAGLLIGSGK